MTRATLLFVLMAFFAAASARGQSSYTQQVEYLLDAAGDHYDRDGYHQTHDYEISSLREDETETWTFDLDDDYEYQIVGVCDTDCDDLDMTLYDENGNEIDKDVLVDDFPIVSVQPRWRGEFRLEVRMYSCDVQPCFYGVGIFGRYN